MQFIYFHQFSEVVYRLNVLKVYSMDAEGN